MLVIVEFSVNRTYMSIHSSQKSTETSSGQSVQCHLVPTIVSQLHTSHWNIQWIMYYSVLYYRLCIIVDYVDSWLMMLVVIHLVPTMSSEVKINPCFAPATGMEFMQHICTIAGKNRHYMVINTIHFLGKNVHYKISLSQHMNIWCLS